MSFKTFLLFSLLSCTFSAFSFDRYKVVSNVDGERLLAMDVVNYIESFVITPGIEAILKAKAIDEGSEYRVEKDKLINHIFLPISEKMTLTRLLQKNAILNKKRQFFSLTKDQLDKLVTLQISKITNTLKKDNMSDLDAKIELLSQLRKSRINSDQLSNIELWQNFKNKIKFNIVERYRESEAQRYLCNLGNCDFEGTHEIFKFHSKRFKRSHFVSFSVDSDTVLKNADAIDYFSRGPLNFENEVNQEIPQDNRPRRFLFLGEIISNKVEFRHINDWDLTSGIAPLLLGYPRTDDQGRTSGLNLSYESRGTNGTLSLELENFLFSRKVSRQGHLTSQEIEEDSSIRLVSRQFLDESGKKWILLGVSVGHRTQSAGIHSFIQAAFHTLNPKTSDREYLDRDHTNLFVQGLIGIGGKYSLIDTKHVDLIIGGEALLNPTIGLSERNSFTVRSSIDLNISGSYENYPILSIGLFGEYSFMVNGTQESVVGGKISLGKVFRSVYYQASLFVVKWDRDLDRTYEGAASWTTGISLSATFIHQRPEIEYVLN